MQLPAWNEALGLPRPWDQQWSLRMQQILAYETDLLEYGDLFDGSPVVEAKVEALVAEARDELARIEAMGGALAAVETGYMKQRLVESSAAPLAAIAAGAQVVVGVNRYTESAPSPLTTGEDGGFMTVDPLPRPSRSSACGLGATGATPRPSSRAWPSWRPRRRRAETSCRPRSPAPMPASPPASGARRCAKCSASTAPPPASAAPAPRYGRGRSAGPRAVEPASRRLGRRLKMLVGKPGLDGHSNGAEQIAVAARDSGFEVVYEGIRLTPARIANTALEEGVHVVGLSILSGSHLPLVTEVLERMRKLGVGACRSSSAASSRPRTRSELRAAGVARVYTPKDYDIHGSWRISWRWRGRGCERRRRRSLAVTSRMRAAGTRGLISFAMTNFSDSTTHCGRDDAHQDAFVEVGMRAYRKRLHARGLRPRAVRVAT